MHPNYTMPLSPNADDLRSLIQDKYAGRAEAVTDEDVARLASGEPLAYIIGWQPFLGLRLALDSRPLIPRPETEWWTERLIAHLQERFGESPFTLLDLGAGSGAIGLAVAKHLSNAHVTLTDIEPSHLALIQENARTNGVPEVRIELRTSDGFENLTNSRFDVIASNPPYIPEGRTLPESVTAFEPERALFSGTDGLDLIRKIAEGAHEHLSPGGELWLEADAHNVHAAGALIRAGGALRAEVVHDMYDRPRLVVSYW